MVLIQMKEREGIPRSLLNPLNKTDPNQSPARFTRNTKVKTHVFNRIKSNV